MYLNNADITEILQCHEILGLAEAVQVPAAKGKRSKVVVDCPKQLLGLRHPQWYMPNIKVLHVMTAFQVLPYKSLACK